MLMPKKTRYRKVQRGTMAGRPRGRGGELVFGDYGLQAIDPAWLTAQQIESARVTMVRKMKKTGTLYLRPFPDKPVTKKPAETRMGKGKGNVELWVAVVKRGGIICELSGVDEVLAREILRAASYKLPMPVRFIKKDSSAQEGS